MRLFLVISFLLLSGFSTLDDEQIVKDRLASLQKDVPLPYNKYVTSYINVYEKRKVGQTAKMLALSEHYFPMIERVFTQYDIPLELKYMAVIESALDPEAVSRVGATGLWQFMYSTAREYKLSVGAYVDERRDPEKSTVAAAKYLKKMHGKYGDWLLAIASYNCGPGNVNKAIRRSGGKRDFWSIYRYLPRETRGYVPAFVGATYVMEYADVLGIQPNHSGSEYLAYTTVSFRKELLMPDLIDRFDLDRKKIRKANSSLTGEIIPADYALKLPPAVHADFYASIDELYASSELKIEDYRSKQKKQTYSYAARVVPDDPNLESILYTVKEGDNLGFISYWYDTGLGNLKAWNGLRRNKIVVGQELIVYVQKEKMPSFTRYDKLSNRQKNILSSDRAQRMLYAKRFDNKYIYHEVKKGETFSSIRNKYEDVTVEMIKELNHVGDRDLMPGMYLKIKENG